LNKFTLFSTLLYNKRAKNKEKSMFTVQYIANDMGLTVSYVRKCVQQLDGILKHHYVRGDFNQIQFTQSGYIIFDQIKQLKEQGLSITAIKERLEQPHSTQDKQSETIDQNIFNHIESSDLHFLNKLFQEKEARLKEKTEHQQLIIEIERRSLKEKEEHQQRIFELEHLSSHLKEQLLYITDGKSPDEYKSAWYQEQIEKQHLREQLSNLTDGKPPEEFKKQLQQEQLEKQRISWLIKEIENLEGIFSIVNYFKRKKLYRELQGLMTKQTNPSSNDVNNET